MQHRHIQYIVLHNCFIERSVTIQSAHEMMHSFGVSTRLRQDIINGYFEKLLTKIFLLYISYFIFTYIFFSIIVYDVAC